MVVRITYNGTNVATALEMIRHDQLSFTQAVGNTNDISFRDQKEKTPRNHGYRRLVS